MTPPADVSMLERLREEFIAWWKFLGILAAAGGWFAIRLRRWRKRRAARYRYLKAGADASRFLMAHFFGSETRSPESYEESQRCAVVINHEIQCARREEWMAQGHPDPEMDPVGAEVVRELLRRARMEQCCRAVDDEQPPDRGGAE